MKSQDELPQLLSLKYVCARLQVHPNTLRTWEKKGLIMPFRFGLRGDRRYRKEDIERLLTPKKYKQQLSDLELRETEEQKRKD